MSAAIVLSVVTWVAADHGLGMGRSFLVLAPGFTQEIFGVSPTVLFSNGDILGGVAFAPDGDPWVSDCVLAQGNLHRFDKGGVAPEVNLTRLHPEQIVPSAAGCGLVNGADGFLYTNTASGVVRIDVNTGTSLGLIHNRPGNALGIAVDPQTLNLYYVAQECDQNAPGACPIHEITAAGAFVRTITLAGTQVSWVDGMYFDPTGNFLFLSNRQNDGDADFENNALFDEFRLTVLKRDPPDVNPNPLRPWTIAQHVPMACEPDGVAFHAGPPRYVVTNNTNICEPVPAALPPLPPPPPNQPVDPNNPGGTVFRFDFPGAEGDDYTQPPLQTLLAAGGFRGDLMQVGGDKCLYLTQAQTRYDNLAETDENSLVRICEPGGAGFAPPPGVETPSPDLRVDKTAFASPINAGATASFTVTVSNIGPGDATNVVVTDTLPPGTWMVSAPADARCPTTATGSFTCTFTGALNPFLAQATVNITVSRTTTAADCGTLLNSASASASNEPTDVQGNNRADASITVNCPDIRVQKTAAASPINAGATASFTVTVSNIGQGAAINVVVTDTLPSGTWTVSAPPDAGCTATATGTLRCSFTGTLNPFAAGASVSITVSRATTTADCGTLTNTASASASNEPSTVQGNNSASASINVQCPPPPPPADCKMTGGGEFVNNANQKDSFGLIAQTKQNGGASGHFNLVNHVTGLHVNGPVTQVTCGPAGSHTVKFSGTDTKRSCMFTVEVQDNGEPGIEDRLLEVTFSCGSQVTPPDAETLLNGNLQFHPTHD